MSEGRIRVAEVSHGFSGTCSQQRQSGLKTGGVVGPGLKTRGSLVLKVQQKEVHSTGFRVSSLETFI